MGKFQWEGVNRGGQSTSGTMVADDADAVGAALRRQRIRATKIAPAGSVCELGQRVVFVPVGQLRLSGVIVDRPLPLVDQIFGFAAAVDRMLHHELFVERAGRLNRADDADMGWTIDAPNFNADRKILGPRRPRRRPVPSPGRPKGCANRAVGRG